MHIPPKVAFSTTVLEDLQALADHLHSQVGEYDPRVGISLDRVTDFIRMQAGARGGVVSLPPGEFGGPTVITPVHDALDRLQLMLHDEVDYATGIVELTVCHDMSDPLDVDFQDRRFVHTRLNRLPEPFMGLVTSIQMAVNAHLMVVVPSPFRPDTLVLVILLGRYERWSEQHEQVLYRTLEPATGMRWQSERKQLK